MLFREVIFIFLRKRFIQKTKKFFNIEHGGTYSKPLSSKELISRQRSSTWDWV